MTSPEAAKLLELPVDASLEQIEARFLDLRRKLEDKIAKAPTPGLQAKYRESLTEITTAFETLTLAADGSSLPLLNKQSAVSSQPSAGTSASAAASSSGFRSQVSGLPSKPKASNKEFLIVTVMALAVLGAGGWFVMKTRAENAERARLADEAKLAAVKADEEKHLADEIERQRLAEEKRKADEEKEQAALAAKTEQQRIDKLTAQVRVQLAEAKLAWEQVEREEREAERVLSELKGAERDFQNLLANANRNPAGAGSQPVPDSNRLNEFNVRINIQTAFNRWLGDFIARHPARLNQVRAAELLAGQQVDEAAVSASRLAPLITEAHAEISRKKEQAANAPYGKVVVENNDPDVKWFVLDAFGQEFTGSIGTTLTKVGIGRSLVIFRRKGWPEQSTLIAVASDRTARAEASFKAAEVRIASTPSGAEVVLASGQRGTTPATFSVIPGELSATVSLSGYKTVTLAAKTQPGGRVELETSLVAPTDSEILTDLTRELAGTWSAQGGDLRQGITSYLQFTASQHTVVAYNSTNLQGFATPLLLADRTKRSLNGKPLATYQFEHEIVLSGDNLNFIYTGKSRRGYETGKILRTYHRDSNAPSPVNTQEMRSLF